VMSPEVDLALEFRNTGSQALVFLVGGDEGVPGLELKGPGVISVSGPTGIQAQFLKGTRVTLAPGKTHTVPIKRLSFDSRIRSQFHRFYWAEAGVYTLTASYLTAVSPVPKGSKNRGDGFGAVTVTSAPARLTVVEPTESQKVQAKTDSPEVPLEARLVARKDTYALDLGGKTPEEIRTEIKQAYKTRKYPPVPAVDLVLEVTNTGKEGMRVSFEEGNQTVLTLDLRGRGAAAVGNLKSPDTKPVKFVELGPGKSRSIPITSLLHSYGTRQTYWTEPGEYTLRARLRTVALTNRNAPKEGGPAPGRRFVTLTSNLIKLKVVEGEKGKE